MRFLVTCFFFIFTSTANASDKISIVVSFSILEDFAKNLCRGIDEVTIQTLIPLDADPHIYEPKPKDIIALGQAHIIFLNGLHFEPKVEAAVASSGFAGIMCYVSEGIPCRLDCNDPHAWHNVHNAITYVKNMATKLKEILPTKAGIINANAQEYISQLNELHTWIQNQLALVSAEKRLVITTHDAFWYYGQAYRVQFLSPIGTSTEEQQPSADKIRELINVIRDKGINVIFVENLANNKQIQQIADEAKIETLDTLYADSLSKKNDASTFINMMRHNTLRIIQSFKR